jgi:dTDP-glucose 4,6-dehydratase
MGNRVVVTGGLGFMGSHFVKYLHHHSLTDHIVVFDNLSYSADQARLSSLPERSYELVIGDIRDQESVDSVSAEADYLFNFAAETHNDNSLMRPKDFLETNVTGVFNILQAARKNSFHFHQISTDEVFGDLPLGSPERFTETSAYKPSSPYSASKAASDMLVLSWVRSFGVRATLTNSANNYGDFQDPEKLIPRSIGLLAQGKKPELYGNGKNIRDWLHVDDHSSAVWRVATAAKNGSRYLVSRNQLLSNIELMGLINQRFGKKANDLTFIAERPGHDLMYASDATLLRTELGWAPTGPSMQKWLEAIPV